MFTEAPGKQRAILIQLLTGWRITESLNVHYWRQLPFMTCTGNNMSTDRHCPQPWEHKCHQVFIRNGWTPDQSGPPNPPLAALRESSDNVFEAVGGVAGQPHALAATAQVLTVRPLHVNVPLLLLTAAAGLRTTLRYKGGDRNVNGKGQEKKVQNKSVKERETEKALEI